MTNIINSSLRSSQVPKSMKSAIVTPLLKKSTLVPDILKNYRPVSNLSYISKLLERVVAGRLTDYMTENNLHEHLQSAYKPGHSTETALVKVQNDILTSIDQHGVVIQVNLDMTDSMGPGKLVRHMQNPSYTYDKYLICIGLGPSISSVICKKSVIQWSVISKFTCTGHVRSECRVRHHRPWYSIQQNGKYIRYYGSSTC